jgi:hypothetical protein
MKQHQRWFFVLLLMMSLPAFSSGQVAFAQENPASKTSDEWKPVKAGLEEHATDESDTKALAQAAQNPIASMISVPFQSNFNFGMGSEDKMGYTMNIQPVIPMKINDDWNLITRVITPLTYQPELTAGGEDYFGLGDVNPQFYFATTTGKLIWGVGPQFTFPTATESAIGSEKYSAGPTAVVLTIDGHWVYGVLANNQWSYAGDDDRRKVNAMVVQPFVNYNLAKGWYLTSSPIMTANWAAVDNDNIWTVPVGGGVGKILKIGQQPVNMQLAYFYNVEHPSGGADQQVRFQVQLMFPVKK